MNSRLSALEIKAAIPPVEFYLQEQPDMPPPRRESGWVDGGLCVFHPDRNRGNFKVSLDTGAYRCFACGESGGDIIAFLQARDGESFVDVLRTLTDQWGVCQ